MEENCGERETVAVTAVTAVTAARDRAEWKTRVDGPILLEERRN